MITRLLFSILALSLSVAPAVACTSLIATKGATKDGSVIVTYAADSHNLFGELYRQPAADHRPGTVRKIVEWDTGKPLGEIPEITHTYSTVGNMNEHGLVIAESTWGGREELRDTAGIIDYGSLIYVTLQRARTAREAIDTMTSLVSRYGYASGGESFTIADPEEAWVMDLIGKGSKEKGAVWVARRVPDGYIAGHANQARIHQFPLNDRSGMTLYSPDVIGFAREMGYYEGADEDFSFSLAYDPPSFGTLRSCDARVWAYFNKFSQGMEEYLPWIDEGKSPVLPLWVKPDSLIDAEDIKWMMRDHYEGTPYDMTADIGAGPYAVPYRWRPLTFKVDGAEYVNERAIATQQTGFSFVARLKADLPGQLKGLLWFGTDDANTCVYLPIYCGLTEVPRQLAHGNGDMNTLSWDSNFWVNNYVANQVYHRYNQMIDDVRQVQGGLEKNIVEAVRSLEERSSSMLPLQLDEEVNRLASYWAREATSGYKGLGDFLLVKYMDGNIKKQNDDGSFKRNGYGMPLSPKYGGYDEKYYRSIVEDTGDKLKVKEITVGK